MDKEVTLKDIQEILNNNEDVISEEDYQKWKKYYESLSESEKIAKMFNITKQLFRDRSSTGIGFFKSMMQCTERYYSEKED